MAWLAETRGRCVVRTGELVEEVKVMKHPASEGRIRRLSRCQPQSTKTDKHQEKGRELKDRQIPEVRRGLAWGIWGPAGVSIWNLDREAKRVTVPGPEHRMWAGSRDRPALPFELMWA